MPNTKPSHLSEPQLFETFLKTYAEQAAKGRADTQEVAALVGHRLGLPKSAVLAWAEGARVTCPPNSVQA